MYKKNYAEKLTDPRWQKKRLEVLSRDGWSCQRCSDTSSTLHVHHKRYTGEPWDAPLEDLVTLCAECHASTSHTEKEVRGQIESLTCDHVFDIADIQSILCDVYAASAILPPDTLVYVVSILLNSPEVLRNADKARQDRMAKDNEHFKAPF